MVDSTKSKVFAIVIAVGVVVIVVPILVWYFGFYHKGSSSSSSASSSSSSSNPPPNNLSSTAAFTYYSSFPFCCPNSPNYDPNAPTDECVDYSGCDYLGQFQSIGTKSFGYVQTHNLVAFYDNSDPNGQNFDQYWGTKMIQVTKDCNGQSFVFQALIADTCANSDCNGCCADNASQSTGYLIDMEYYTVMRNFGTTDCVGGEIAFTVM